MNQVVHVVRDVTKKNELMEQFLRWQCRVRQMSMRDAHGKPDDGITPALTLPGNNEPMGHIITVLSKWGGYSKTPEMRHMVKRTNDPAHRREKAVEYFSSAFYQNIHEFSDSLTATFPPHSKGARVIEQAGECTLTFSAYSQAFDLICTVSQLSENNPLYQATFWHNLLFNPNLHPQTTVLQFKPDWDRSTSQLV
ncbi:MAG: hypothetical protein AB8B63_16225 [Granulosicoccus sp.]